MASAGSFAALRAAEGWIEMMTCASVDGEGGCRWLACTLDGVGLPRFTCVEVAPGSVVLATSRVAGRRYPGIDAGSVAQIMLPGCLFYKASMWCPSSEEVRKLCDRASALLAQCGIFRGDVLWKTGTSVELINYLPRPPLPNSVEPLPGKFAAIFCGSGYTEVLLLKIVAAADCTNLWICCMNSGGWTAVRLEPGSFIITDDSRSGRKYPYLIDSEIDWIWDGGNNCTWTPTRSLGHDLVGIATNLEMQLGAMRVHACASSGTEKGRLPCLPLPTSIEPASGKFAAVLCQEGLVEVLLVKLVVAADGAPVWLCYTHYFTWAALRLVPGFFSIAHSASSDRGYPFLVTSQVRQIFVDDMVWDPTPAEGCQLLERATHLELQLGAIPLHACVVSGTEADGLQHLPLPTPVQPAPGKFAVILCMNGYNEVLLVKSAMAVDGAQVWLCYTTNQANAFTWTAVRLVPGSFLVVDDTSASRMYPFLADASIHWMVCPDDYFANWSPTAVEAERLLSELAGSEAAFVALSSQVYVNSGDMRECLPSLPAFTGLPTKPATGKFVVIEWGRCLKEILLCKQLANPEYWLCLTFDRGTTSPSFHWTGVRLSHGYVVFESTGASRSKVLGPGYELDLMLKPPGWDQVWAPTPARIRKALKDVEELAKQLEAEGVPLERFAQIGTSEETPESLPVFGSVMFA